jgi:release factor glutamine methyltransferase
MTDTDGGVRPTIVVPSSKTFWTVGELLDWTAKFLVQKGSESGRLDAEVLLAHALNCRRIELYTRYTEPAADEARDRFRELVRRRVKGCPVAYLVGRKEFFSLELEVSPAVLIPRPDTELVVVEFLQLAKLKAFPTVLDVGTGSGCLAVAIAKRQKGAQVTAVDLSPDALAVASRNADLFAPLTADERFDFIVSNPPYIPTADLADLAPGVRDYEPHLALDGGEDGFAVFERLLAGAEDRLKPDGWLLVEIGAPQEASARQRIAARPGYESVEVLIDGSGHPRVLKARRQPKE